MWLFVRIIVFVLLFYKLDYMYVGGRIVSTKCLSYNSTLCSENEQAEGCNTVVNCENASNQCFVLWTNKGNSTSVQLKGCFISSGDCNGQSLCVEKGNEKANQGLLFCCCEGDLCNKDFYWEPTQPPPTEIQMVKEDDSIMNIVYMIAAVSLIVLFLLMFLLKKRKLPYFNQTSSLEELPPTSPSPVQEKLRDIQLIEVRASGKFGTVYKACYKNNIVAVKAHSVQEKQCWQTEQEVYKLPLMNHQNILQYFGAEKRGLGNSPSEFWLITAYHEIGSLHDFLKCNTISWDQLCHIAYSMTSGLAYLHEEIPSEKVEYHKPAIAHRDFKSSNVLLKDDLTACIADFGLALIFRPNQPCGETHGQVGTRRYMAPEVLEGAISFSRDSFLRIDMYACALVLWELASRCTLIPGVGEYKLPFEEEVGLNPSLDDMQEVVAHKRLRPIIKPQWRQHVAFSALCDTIEDTWDGDVEARLSAPCVLERISYQMHSFSLPDTSLLLSNGVVKERNHFDMRKAS